MRNASVCVGVFGVGSWSCSRSGNQTFTEAATLSSSPYRASHHPPALCYTSPVQHQPARARLDQMQIMPCSSPGLLPIVVRVRVFIFCAIVGLGFGHLSPLYIILHAPPSLPACRLLGLFHTIFSILSPLPLYSLLLIDPLLTI